MITNISSIVRYLYPGDRWFYESRSGGKTHEIYNWAKGLRTTSWDEDELLEIILEDYGEVYMSRLQKLNPQHRAEIVDLVGRIIANKRRKTMPNMVTDTIKKVHEGEVLYSPQIGKRVKVIGVTEMDTRIRFITIDGSNYSDTVGISVLEPLVEQAIERRKYHHAYLGEVEVVGYDPLANEAIVKTNTQPKNTFGETVKKIRYSVSIKSLVDVLPVVELYVNCVYRLLFTYHYTDVRVISKDTKQNNVTVVLSDLSIITLPSIIAKGQTFRGFGRGEAIVDVGEVQ